MHVIIDADRYEYGTELDAAIQETQAVEDIDRITIAEARVGRWVRWRRDGTGAWNVDASASGRP